MGLLDADWLSEGPIRLNDSLLGAEAGGFRVRFGVVFIEN